MKLNNLKNKGSYNINNSEYIVICKYPQFYKCFKSLNHAIYFSGKHSLTKVYRISEDKKKLYGIDEENSLKDEITYNDNDIILE